MARSVAKRLAWKDEQGAYLVLTAILVPAVVVLGALTFGTTSLWTAHDDIQRSADLGAAAGAASTPAAAVTPSAAWMPIPVEGKTITKLYSELDPGNWQDRPCLVATEQLTDGRSAVTNAFKQSDPKQSCTTTWTHESPTLAAVAACAADLIDVTGCASTLRSQLVSTLPPLASTDANLTTAMTKAQSVANRYANPAFKFLNAAAAQQLPGGCVKTVRVITGLTSSLLCQQSVSSLLSPFLGPVTGAAASTTSGICASPAGQPIPCVDLDGLLPAALTPRTTVQFDGVKIRPTLSPFTFNVNNSATARRTIKSAAVLPSALIPYNEIDVNMEAQLGASSATLKSATGVGGFLIDPNFVTRDANGAIDRKLARLDTLDVVDKLDSVIGGKIVTAYATAACSHAPMSRFCPNLDTVAATRAIRGQFVQDLHDATNPPPQGAEPSLNQMLDTLADSGEAALFTSPFQLINLRKYFGESAWSVLTDPSINPALAPLLSEVMYMPALDVVPATVGRVVIGGKSYYVLHDLRQTVNSVPWSDTLAAKGLFQARLVK